MSKPLTPAQQQKQQQLEIQGITSLLQAGLQNGTDKLLINVNGQNSKLPTNKNSIVKYTLEQPLKLEIGDKVTLVDSFVEERGLSVDTISFEDDVEEEMRFLYYTQGDCRNTQTGQGTAPYSGIGADIEFTHFPNVYPDYFAPKDDVNYAKGVNGNFFRAFGESTVGVSGSTACFPSPNYITTGQSSNASGFGNTEEVFKTTGANGQYYYMGEWWNPFPADKAVKKSWKSRDSGSADKPNSFFADDNPAYSFFWRPTYGAAVIKIPAGNYSVSALSDLINNQLNGSISTKNRFNSNVLIDKLFKDTTGIGFVNTSPFFSGLTEPMSGDVESPLTYNPDVAIIGEDTHQPYQRRRGNIMTKAIIPPNIVSNMVNMQSMRFKGATDSRPTSNILYADEHTKVVYGSGTGAGLGAGRGDFPASGLAQNYDKTVWNNKQSKREQAKTFSTNCYLHLDGMTQLFETDNFMEADIENMPSLADWFLGNIGDEGKFYLNQNLANLNYQPPDATANVYYWSQVEDLKWSMMFGVGSSSLGKDGFKFGQGSVGGPQLTAQQMAGTTSFSVSYDLQSTNRFTITDLHEPYKLASSTPDGGSSTNLGGQQATNYNSPMDFNFATDANFVQPVRQLCGIYPIESVGGVAVNNFSFNSVKNTNVYKDLVAKIAAFNEDDNNGRFQMIREKTIYELFTKPYDQFFDSVSDAQVAWSKTLWARLGFDYTQLGDVSSNLESIFSFTNAPDVSGDASGPVTQPNIVKQKGIITHNDFDYTFIPSSDGLGLGNPYLTATAGAPPQSYGLRGYGVSCNESDTGTTGVTANNIHILANSKPINASNFPSLNNGNNYLIIESDIVKSNAKDAQSNSSTIVGIMSKENASNDTIYSVDPISFTVTEPRLLASIEVKIKNPDGSLVSDNIIGKNNGFIFQIDKAIRPASIPLMSI